MRVVLVLGVTKYFDLLRRSKLKVNHKDYRPFHLSNEFKEADRQTAKYLAKINWYEKDGGNNNNSWRTSLVGCWRGLQPTQFKPKGAKYSSVLQVPSSKGGILLKELAAMESKL